MQLHAPPRNLASKSVLLTLPLRCDQILSFLHSVTCCYRRPELSILILTIEILFELQDYLKISMLLPLYADAQHPVSYH
jgi:hypothetical protein